jgi:hypothetical protein
MTLHLQAAPANTRLCRSHRHQRAQCDHVHMQQQIVLNSALGIHWNLLLVDTMTGGCALSLAVYETGT